MHQHLNKNISQLKNFDIKKIREDFPILSRMVNGKPLVYLDNAATSQKPQVVIDVLQNYYQNDNSNVHRGVHFLSDRATNLYEEAREKIQKFLNAKSTKEIIYVRGTTEGINLVANSFVKPRLNEGDNIIVSLMEHHANVVPWQLVCDEKKAKIKIIPINKKGELLVDSLQGLIDEKTKFISVVHISNSLGTINPIDEVIEIAHKNNIPILIDGAQSVCHGSVDVQKLDCDFFVFSGHKICGPTGIGALYGKEKWLEEMPPYQGGGDMILQVTFEKTIYNDLPYKFEAGTPNISGAIGLGTALDYVKSIGYENLHTQENLLLKYATEKLSKIDKVQIIGTADNKVSIVSFVMADIHAHDVGTILDQEGVAVRAGHHCTQPVMDYFGVPGTARASFSFYNTLEEVDILEDAVKKGIKIFLG